MSPLRHSVRRWEALDVSVYRQLYGESRLYGFGDLDKRRR
jgi:hypothetical protein